MSTRRAMSLIEVVLAMVILGLAVPPLMLQLASAVSAQTASTIRANLAQLASERVGEIFADHRLATRGYAYIVDSSYPDENPPSEFKGYRRTTTVREVNPADFASPRPGSGIKRVRILVAGPDGTSLTVETFVTDVSGGGLPKEKVEPTPKKKKKGAGPPKQPAGRGPPKGRGGRP